MTTISTARWRSLFSNVGMPMGRFLQPSPLALSRVAKKDFGQAQGSARSRTEVRRAPTTPSLAARPGEAEQRE
jgi:hypothetical protein